VSVKVVPKPWDPEIVPKAGYECALKKWTHVIKGKPEHKLLILELLNFFKEAIKHFILD
jgi:hypothetical protein